MEASRRCTWKIDWEFMEREVYGIVFDNTSMNNNNDTMSSFSGSIEIIMKLPANSSSDEVLSYFSICLNDPLVTNFQN